MKMAMKRGIIVALGVILQFSLIMVVLMFFGNHVAAIETIYAIISILLVLVIIKESRSLSSDLPWIIIILLFPIVGALLYLVIGNNLHKNKVLKSINKQIDEGKKYLVQDKNIKGEIESYNLDKIRYISEYAGFPVYKNTRVQYYPIGEQAYKVMIDELKNAEKYIFIEYFIIKHGKMWQEILEILKEKVKQGLDVRVMYDDLGSIAYLDPNYPTELESYGIKCICFNKLKPFSGVIMNSRDHRKIMIIDGHTAFSGGINLADEYINITHPYKHWKDNGIMIKGEAVWSFTVMFLEMWNSYRNIDKDFNTFKYHFNNAYNEKGYVVPYGESPLDDEIVGENIYLNIINQAKKYVYIFTPYLIIDTDMINSLTLAAKRGVDVRIVVPGVPDKKIVYSLTKSYFAGLIKYGVKMYTYTPGFIHGKVFVSDDNVATVGSLNLDYRSLYHHFECGIYMEDVEEIKAIKNDVISTIDKSHKVTQNEAKGKGLKALWQLILRLFAPLM